MSTSITSSILSTLVDSHNESDIVDITNLPSSRVIEIVEPKTLEVPEKKELQIVIPRLTLPIEILTESNGTTQNSKYNNKYRYDIITQAMLQLKDNDITLQSASDMVDTTITYWYNSLKLNQSISTSNVISMNIKLLYSLIKTNRFVFLHEKVVVALFDLILLNMEAMASRKQNIHPQNWNILGLDFDKQFVLRYKNKDIIGLDGKSTGNNISLDNVSMHFLMGQIMARLNYIYLKEFPAKIPMDKINPAFHPKGEKYHDDHFDYRVRLLKVCKIIFYGVKNDDWNIMQKAIWSSQNVKLIKKIETMALPETQSTSLPTHIIVTISNELEEKQDTTQQLSTKSTEKQFNLPSKRNLQIDQNESEWNLPSSRYSQQGFFISPTNIQNS